MHVWGTNSRLLSSPNHCHWKQQECRKERSKCTEYDYSLCFDPDTKLAVGRRESFRLSFLLFMVLASQSIHPLREQWRNVRGKRINQSINLLGNKGPTATYKSQYTIYNDYSPRQCIQHITNHASEKAVYKLRKILLTVQ